MPTIMDDLTAGARTYLRDYPQYFEVDEGPLNVLTVRLPHPLIMSSSLQVYLTSGGTTSLTAAWELDDRNGLLKLTSATDLGKRCLVAGYYFTWFSDADLTFHIKKTGNEMAYTNGGSLTGLTRVHYDAIMLGGVVHALWSLAMELSLDIDVSTPEGMFIPARQRFTQVMQMLQNYEAQYSDKLAMLNMGLGALEVFRLRRIAYMTNRYVPVYKEREFDDRYPPERLYPPIPYGVPPDGDVEVFSIEEIGREGQDLGFGGWTSVGTRGD